MSECNFDVSSLLFSLYIFMHVHTYVCVRVCVCAWKSTRLARAFSKGLLLSAQINLLSPWVNTLIHLCIWVHVVCVCARVYVSMLIQGRALPNTPWKHSIHQQLEAGALGPALHFHWERGRQRRGGEKGGEKEDMRLPKGREEGHSSECLSLGHEGQEEWEEYIYIKVERNKFPPQIVLQPIVEVHMSVNKT